MTTLGVQNHVCLNYRKIQFQIIHNVVDNAYELYIEVNAAPFARKALTFRVIHDRNAIKMTNRNGKTITKFSVSDDFQFNEIVKYKLNVDKQFILTNQLCMHITDKINDNVFEVAFNGNCTIPSFAVLKYHPPTDTNNSPFNAFKYMFTDQKRSENQKESSKRASVSKEAPTSAKKSKK